jgi:hypothetical protein
MIETTAIAARCEAFAATHSGDYSVTVAHVAAELNLSEGAVEDAWNAEPARRQRIKIVLNNVTYPAILERRIDDCVRVSYMLPTWHPRRPKLCLHRIVPAAWVLED